MPRPKKLFRFSTEKCALCPNLFRRVRADARYCGPACRQRISRMVREYKARQARKNKPAHATGWECGACGIELPADTVRCACCGSNHTIRKVPSRS